MVTSEIFLLAGFTYKVGRGASLSQHRLFLEAIGDVSVDKTAI
ncbi:hypothetical protein PLIP_a2265 [Pseudoalteromonas lipolytica LMEB 39]|nr:hypothetical protein [Pseudoalteromonas lipolytica LMEB 39]